MKLCNHTFKRNLSACVLAVAFGASSWVLADQPEDKQDDKPPTAVVPEPSIENGDVDGSGGITITDVLYMVNFLYLGGPALATASCGGSGSESPRFAPDKTNGDIDGDGSVSITDVIRLVNWLFLGGSAPEAISCVAESGAV